MKNSKTIPSPKGPFFIGQYPRFKKNPLKFFLDMSDEYGSISNFTLAGFNFTMLTNPEHIEFVFKNDHKLFVKSKAAKKMSPIVGDGLILSDNPLWSRQRKLVAPSFHRSNLSQIVPLISDITLKYFKELETDDDFEVNFSYLFTDITLHILSQFFITGQRHEAPEDIYLICKELLDFYGNRSAKKAAIPMWIPTKKHREIKQHLKNFDKFIYSTIRKIREDNNEDILMGKLLCAKDENGYLLSEKLARDELATFVFAGHETSSIALAWTVYELSKNRSAYKKLQKKLMKS